MPRITTALASPTDRLAAVGRGWWTGTATEDAAGSQSFMAASEVSIKITGSSNATVAPWSQRICRTVPAQGEWKSKTDLALSACAKICPFSKQSPGATNH